MKLDHLLVRRRARVEMIPLIDCMFILLVFFVYSMLAMTIERGIVVQLPESGDLQGGEESAVVVSITEAGSILVNREPVALPRLGDAVRRARRDAPEAPVVLNADARSRHRDVFAVMDLLRGEGITRFQIRAQEAAP